MAGICAVLGRDAEQLTRSICKRIWHRGPDDEGLFVDGDVALGHRALYINNISVPHQPLANEDETIWITFDGQIYNSGELRSRLEKTHMFKGDSPAEVIVHSYEEDGFACLSKFNGMFAFCLWDSSRRKLFSARDRVGSKPLYYYQSVDHTILCSEIKGILADMSIPRKPNKRFIYEYLAQGYHRQNGDSFFEGIKEVLPAHGILLTDRQLEVKRYWYLEEHPERSAAKSDETYASEFRRLLRDSISLRLPAGFPVGVMLSGGLDSTCITFMVNNLINSGPRADVGLAKLQQLFSAVYKEHNEQGDEIRFIKQVEDALKNKANYVYPSVTGRWGDIKRFIFYIEEPVAVFNYYVFWCLFQAMRKRVGVVLSGQGCDAILGGQTDHVLTYYAELWRKRKIGVLLDELMRSSDWLLPSLIYRILFKGSAESRAKALLGKEFVKKYDQNIEENDAQSLQEALARDITCHAPEYLRVDDRASSAFSIECRHPYLDNRMVEFAFSLPSNQKIRKGLTKYVVRNAMKGGIPEAIRKRKKKFGTPIPQQRWMTDLYKEITQTFSSQRFLDRECFNQTAVLNLFHRYCSGALNRIKREHYRNLLWRILNLELWLEIFFDHEDTID